VKALGHYRDRLINVLTTPPAGRRLWLERAGCAAVAAIGLLFLIILPFRAPELRAAGIGSLAWEVANVSRALLMLGIALWGAALQPWRSSGLVEQRQGRVLAIVTLLLVGQLAITFSLDQVAQRYLLVTLSYLVAAAGCWLVYWLARRGYVRLGAGLLTWSFLAQVAQNLGTESFALALVTHILGILIAGLLIRWWAGLLMAALFPLLFLMIQSDPWNVLPALGRTPGDGYGLDGYTVLLLSIAALAALYAHSLEAALHSADARAGELRQAQASLEQQVLERTAQLDKALRDAREARAIAEKAREEADTANQLKTQFLATMSHELRTPLNAIINFAEFTLDPDYGTLNDDQTIFQKRVIYNGEHLLSLISDILDLSKIEAGRMTAYFEAAALAPIAQRSLATAAVLVGDKRLELRLDAPDDLPLAWIDPQRIGQVLLNLLSNAVKFTEEGAVTLRAAVAGDMLRIAVADTGIGIPPDSQSVIFEAFRQIDSNLARQYQGTGLGLAISKHIVEIHGGSIWLESAPGAGSTFTFTLPIYRPENTP